MSTNFEEEGLRRKITRTGVAALVLNGMLGAGIFALPAAVASEVGTFSPFIFLICGALFLPVVLAFARVASYYRSTGGPVLYAREAFGPFVGFQTGWLLWLGRVTAFAANGNALLDYGGLLWSDLNSGLVRVAVMGLIFCFLTASNVVGVDRGMTTTNVLTVLKLTPLFLFIGAGFAYITPGQFVGASFPPQEGLAAALLLVVYAFVGFEGALVPAGESRNPEKDIPKALLLTVCVTALFYALIQTVCLSVIPDLSATRTPVSDVAGVLFGVAGATLMTVTAFLSIAGNLSSTMLTAPRMTYVMANAGSLPASLGKINEKYRTPAWSIVLLGVLAFVLAISGTFKVLAIMSSLTRMIGYGVCIAALPRLKKKLRPAEERGGAGAFVIPGFAFAVCLWLAMQADLSAWSVTGVFVAAGTLLFLWSKKKYEMKPRGN